MTDAKKISNQQPQTYDTGFKEWVEQQPATILPVLLPGAAYQETVSVELVRSVMRADKVFKINYAGEDHIFHLEFESGTDHRMTSRLLAYNAILYRDHHVPVISMIVYPFRTETAQTPLRLFSGTKELLTFHFQILPLFSLSAEQYVHDHVVCMYPLLPTMQGTTVALIKQAL
ncbi:MAG TPA: hypothetical protein VKX46_02290, partial [Ktedonobacteraceae bacterium]|nr:hypothetical protein [Ktedonobacteraceae bacterium]